MGMSKEERITRTAGSVVNDQRLPRSGEKVLSARADCHPNLGKEHSFCA